MEYKELEAILAELHRVRLDGMAAFRSRLRVLRDIGVPSVVRPGKGSRVTYQFKDLWQTHLALHLEQFGLPPLRVKFVTEERDRWLQAMREREKSEPSDIWLYLWLWNMQSSAAKDDQWERTMIETLDLIFPAIRRAERERHPAMVTGLLNLSQLTRECETAMTKHVK